MFYGHPTRAQSRGYRPTRGYHLNRRILRWQDDPLREYSVLDRVSAADEINRMVERVERGDCVELGFSSATPGAREFSPS
jgi:hypothetical protein